MKNLFALIFILIFSPGSLFAKTIVVDGNETDWNGVPAVSSNTLTLNQDEYIWKDALEDERRTNVYDGTKNENKSCDLTEFRVCTDATNLYFLIRFKELAVGTTGISYPLVQVAIDYSSADLATYNIPSFVDQNFTDSNLMPQVNENARWEYLLSIYQAVPSTSTVFLVSATANSVLSYSSSQNSIISDFVGVYAQRLGANGFMEVSIPLKDIGQSGNYFKTPNFIPRVRFTVAVFLHSGIDGWDNISKEKSLNDTDLKVNIMDCISPLTTGEEIQDNTVNFYFQTDFGTNGSGLTPPTPPQVSALLVDSLSQNQDVSLKGRQPVFAWTYTDSGGAGQSTFELQVGNDNDWTNGAERWSTVQISTATEWTYQGSSALSEGTTYWCRVRVMNERSVYSDWLESSFHTFKETVPLAVGEDMLEIDYNNPFSPDQGEITKFRYGVNKESNVQINIYTLSGKPVKSYPEIVGQSAKSGIIYTLNWNGRNDEGEPVSPGIYLVVMWLKPVELAELAEIMITQKEKPKIIVKRVAVIP